MNGIAGAIELNDIPEVLAFGTSVHKGQRYTMIYNK